MVLSSLVAVRIGAAGSVWDGYESGSAIGRGTKWSVGGEAVWKRGDGGLWSSGRDRRCGRTDGLTALSRNGSLLESGHYVRGEAWHCRSDTVCASRRDACLLAARKALWLWRRARTAA